MSSIAAPLITIIIAVYNGKSTLQHCIDSATQQTYLNKELIIIDGGSDDGTVDLLEENHRKINYWISEPDQGIYNAWNKGLAQAHGDWICFLGADDYFWDATVLERMVVQLEMLPPIIRVAYGQIMLIGLDGQSVRPIGDSWESVKKQFRQDMCIPHVGTMHRRTLFQDVGVFDESFKIAGDYELLLRELKTGDAKFISGITTVGQRLGGVSTGKEYYMKMRQEVWRAQRKHGKLWPNKRLTKEIASEYLRLLLWKIFGERMARKLLDFRRRLKGLPPHWTIH